MGCLLAAVFLAAPSGGRAAEDGGQLIDRFVAVVDGQLFTLSDVELEAKVTLVQRLGEKAAVAPLDGPTLASTLDLMIAEQLETAEADKLKGFMLERGELDAAMSEFEHRFSSASGFERFLARQGADRRRLAEVLERKLRAEKVLDSKVRLRAKVSEQETLRYYQAHAESLDASYEELHDLLRDKLIRDRYARLTADEIALLRSSGDVRLIAPLLSAPDKSR